MPAEPIMSCCYRPKKQSQYQESSAQAGHFADQYRYYSPLIQDETECYTERVQDHLAVAPAPGTGTSIVVNMDRFPSITSSKWCSTPQIVPSMPANSG